MRIILDAKYEKANLIKFMTKQYQHLYTKEQKILLKMVRKFESLFDGTWGPRKKLQWNWN